MAIDMQVHLSPQNDENEVLAEATLKAGSSLGLTQSDIAQIIGRSRSRLRASIRKEDKSGELALLLIRVYRSLFALVDGNINDMQHWMNTMNRGTGGIPREQVLSVQGLSRVLIYLDAIRGKI